MIYPAEDFSGSASQASLQHPTLLNYSSLPPFRHDILVWVVVLPLLPRIRAKMAFS